MGFEQAAIKVEKIKEFEELKSAIERAFQPEKVERFLKQAQRYDLRIRDLDAVVAKGVVEKSDEVLANAGKNGQSLFQALTRSDQAQIREFYLSKLEEVEPKLRAKFQKIYRYY